MNAEEFQAAIQAVDLTATDAREQILALNDGLMKSNATLLTESKANKTAAQEANEATEAARQLAVEKEQLLIAAKEQELISNGKTDELKTFYEGQLADKTAELQVQTDSAVKALNDRDKGAAINDILSQVDPRYKAFVKTQLQSSVSITYDEAGKAVTSIKDGDAQYSSSTDFLNGVKESDTWKHVLTATALSGANTQQSSSSGANAPGKIDGSISERTQSSVAANPKLKDLPLR